MLMARGSEMNFIVDRTLQVLEFKFGDRSFHTMTRIPVLAYSQS